MTSNKKKSTHPVVIERGTDHEVIRPRNLLKVKAGVTLDGPGQLDETAIRRAEQAMNALAVHFNGWMEDASSGLGVARDKLRADGPSQGRNAALYRAAHDIRGQATTLGFPLAARVGASLCLLMDNGPAQTLHEVQLNALVDQHVDAIRAIVREGVTKPEHRIGEALAQELEAITERLLSGISQQKLH
jgi:HPt (histidine-containing phosphotransfer) domain-containing protein